MLVHVSKSKQKRKITKHCLKHYVYVIILSARSIKQKAEAQYKPLYPSEKLRECIRYQFSALILPLFKLFELLWLLVARCYLKKWTRRNLVWKQLWISLWRTNSCSADSLTGSQWDARTNQLGQQTNVWSKTCLKGLIQLKTVSLFSWTKFIRHGWWITTRH